MSDDGKPHGDAQVGKDSASAPPGRGLATEIGNELDKKAREFPVAALLGVPAFFSTILPILFAAGVKGTRDPSDLARYFHLFAFAYFLLPLGFMVLRAFLVPLPVSVLTAVVFLGATYLLTGHGSVWMVALMFGLCLATAVLATERWARPGRWAPEESETPPAKAGEALFARLAAGREGMWRPFLPFAIVGVLAFAGAFKLAGLDRGGALEQAFSWTDAVRLADTADAQLRRAANGVNRRAAEAHAGPVRSDTGAASLAEFERLQAASAAVDTQIRQYHAFVNGTLVHAVGATGELDTTLVRRSAERLNGGLVRTGVFVLDSASVIDSALVRDSALVLDVALVLDSLWVGRITGNLNGLRSTAEVYLARLAAGEHAAARMVQRERHALYGVTGGGGGSPLASPEPYRALQAAESRRALFTEARYEAQEALAARLTLADLDLERLRKAKERRVQESLRQTYERTRSVGRMLFAASFVVLLIGSLLAFGTDAGPDARDTAGVAARARGAYAVALALIVVLSAPLLPRIEAEEINPRSPLSFFLLPSWYLPGFVSTTARQADRSTVSVERVERRSFEAGDGTDSIGPLPPLPPDTTLARMAGSIEQLRSDLAANTLELAALRAAMPDSFTTREIRNQTTNISQKLDTIGRILNVGRQP